MTDSKQANANEICKRCEHHIKCQPVHFPGQPAGFVASCKCEWADPPIEVISIGDTEEEARQFLQELVANHKNVLNEDALKLSLWANKVVKEAEESGQDVYFPFGPPNL